MSMKVINFVCDKFVNYSFKYITVCDQVTNTFVVYYFFVTYELCFTAFQIPIFH